MGSDPRRKLLAAQIDALEVFEQADKLMYGGKKSGKGRCLFARIADPESGVL